MRESIDTVGNEGVLEAKGRRNIEVKFAIRRLMYNPVWGMKPSGLVGINFSFNWENLAGS